MTLVWSIYRYVGQVLVRTTDARLRTTDARLHTMLVGDDLREICLCTVAVCMREHEQGGKDATSAARR